LVILLRYSNFVIANLWSLELKLKNGSVFPQIIILEAVPKN